MFLESGYRHQFEKNFGPPFKQKIITPSIVLANADGLSADLPRILPP